ncbi:MBL fold metallo-hydrolase [Brevibacterium daeguense]|nr:MBL fold metallo-hydrolase [Brevibacterium daeguense]
MTLDGTNSYVLDSAGGSTALLIDPGPELAEHRSALLAAVGDRDLRGIILTHQHADHSEMLGSIEAWAPEVPVHAVLERFARHSEPVHDGQRISFGSAAEDVVEVIATPGHTADSISVLHGTTLYSGDTVLGRGTTVITHPEGSVGDYLNSLETLRSLVSVGRIETIEPAHGPRIENPAAVLDYYRTHRAERIEQVRQALAAGASGAEEVRDIVYRDVPDNVREAALQIVRAQLEYVSAD